MLIKTHHVLLHPVRRLAQLHIVQVRLDVHVAALLLLQVLAVSVVSLVQVVELRRRIGLTGSLENVGAAINGISYDFGVGESLFLGVIPLVIETDGGVLLIAVLEGVDLFLSG